MLQNEPLRFFLRLLGPPGILTSEGAQVPGLGPGKPFAMLAYLAVRREARREELLELLWGGVPEERARNAFRQALHRLRTALGEELVPQDRERVTLETAPLLEIDRDQLASAIDRGEWLAAADLYRGQFLDGVDIGESAFERWAESERARLRSVAEEAHRKAAQDAMDHARWPEATRLAARLSELAPFDEAAATLEATILAAAGRPNEAVGVLHRFESRLRTDLDLETPPGIRALIARLTKTARARSPADSLPSSTGRVEFVGRESELATLLALIRGLHAEQGATAVLIGEAGIGKTRLIDELIDRSSVLGRLHVARGREPATRGAVPFASVTEALRTLVDAPGVGGASRHLLAEAARLVPELLDAFDLTLPPPIADETARARFFEGVAAFVDAVAYEQPVLMILDDLQHASNSTLNLITYLSQRLRHSPVLLALVIRSDAEEVWRKRLEGLAGAAGSEGLHEPPLIGLTAMGDDETRELVRQIIAARGAARESDVDRIVALAGGHPERVFEIARKIARGEPVAAPPIALREVMWARLQAASPAQRRVFFASALLDRAATLRLLAAAAHLPESAAMEAADRLEQLGLLRQEGVGYRVAHDSTSGFVLDASGAAGRALLAGWAADALSRDPAAEAGDLASLYAVAGQPAEAFRHARDACYAAAAVGAGTDVIELGAIALTFAPDESARRMIEALMAPFGGANPALRLGAGEKPTVQKAQRPTPIESEPPVVSNVADAPATVETRAASSRRWRFGVRELQVALTAAIVLSVGALARQRAIPEASRRSLTDSLLVVERQGSGPLTQATRLITGTLDVPVNLRTAPSDTRGAWADSLHVPWVNLHASPNGSLVAVERVTSRGPDVYVMRGSVRDTIRIPGTGSDIVLGWSPDSRVVLFARGRTLGDGSYVAGLYAYHVGGAVVPIDTSAQRSVTAAAWAPSGAWIGYAARTGPGRQQDIFLIRPDGSGRRNLTNDPSEDEEPAWSPDGSLLAFTSNRAGQRHVYVYDFLNDRTWTAAASTTGIDEHPSYSPDGRYLAFESTRDGDASVYLTFPLGGTATRMTPAGRQFAIAGWRGRMPPFPDVVRVVGSAIVPPRDSASLSALVLDQNGSTMSAAGLTWRSADTNVVRFASGMDGGTASILTERPGTARIYAEWPGWRSDTLTIAVGAAHPSAIADDFSRGIRPDVWHLFGRPRATVRSSAAGSALFPNGDLQWESGALSTAIVDIRRPLSLSARIFAPFDGRPTQAASLELSIVSVVPDGAISMDAPQLSALVSVSWNGESGRLTYAVGPQTYSEKVTEIGAGGSHAFGITVDSDGAVSFSVDRRTRWRSATRFLGSGDLRGRVWLGGRATYQWGAFSDVKLEQR